MPPSELLIPFMIATAGLAFVPGPGLAYMAVQTMAHGPRAGWMSSVAFHIASYVHIVMAAFGVTALLEANPEFLTVLRLAGALYLAWMGVRFLRPRQPRAVAPPPKAAAARAFRDSLMIETVSPDSILFYFLFLPQFVAPGASLPIWAQIIALGAIANVIFTLADVVWIYGSNAVAGAGRGSDRLSRIGRPLAGAVLVLLAFWIAFGAG